MLKTKNMIEFNRRFENYLNSIGIIEIGVIKDTKVKTKGCFASVDNDNRCIKYIYIKGDILVFELKDSKELLNKDYEVSIEKMKDEYNLYALVYNHETDIPHENTFSPCMCLDDLENNLGYLIM